MSRTVAVVLLVAVLFGAVVSAAVATATAQDTQKQNPQIKTVDDESTQVSLGNGVKVLDGEVKRKIQGGAIVELTIKSDRHRKLKFPNLRAAFRSSGRIPTITKDIAEGKNKVETQAFMYDTQSRRGRVYVAQASRNGRAYTIVVNAERNPLDFPPVSEGTAYILGGGGLVGAIYGWVRHRRITKDDEPEEVTP